MHEACSGCKTEDDDLVLCQSGPNLSRRALRSSVHSLPLVRSARFDLEAVTPDAGGCRRLLPFPGPSDELIDDVVLTLRPCMAAVSPTSPSSRRWPARSRPANLPERNGSRPPSSRSALATRGRG